tara:strand:+ start:10516 stop:10713 length:198 start_codon:yes stop_codon:yes gene_type:complete
MSKSNRTKAQAQYTKEMQSIPTDTQEEYDANPTRMYMNGRLTRKQWERITRAELQLAIARMRAQG